MRNRSKLIGKVIADRYCITSEIGAGGMGQVYGAIPFEDPAHDVAIKVILRNRKLSYEDLLRFQKEASLMSRLHHPNIISFYELGLIDEKNSNISGSYYIVMEKARGRDLKEFLKERQSIDFFFDLGLQVSSALEYTHSKNIIHRDIKPHNIMVGTVKSEESGEEGIMVKVLDFGVAKLAEINQDESGRDIAGTPLYMAPETTSYVDAPIDHRSDLYALGCVLYEALAGRPPFQGDSKEKLAREHANSKPEALMTFRADVPEFLNDIIQKLLAKHPDDRYQSAFGFHVDLQKARRCMQMGLPYFSVSNSLARYDGLKLMTGSLDLIGRAEELNLLIDNYSTIAKGRGRSRMTVINGDSGSGKTRLTGEFRSYLAKHKIRHISTGFSRHENNLPFNALANGFNEYLLKVAKSQQLEADEIRMKVREILGSSAKILLKVVPGLRPYIEDHEDLDHEDFDDSFDFSAFAKAFSDFTRCLALENQPIVFILDDMQWADPQSIELVDLFFSHNNSQRFYLVVTYTEGLSVDQEHFHKFIRKFEKLKRRYSEVQLKPLSIEAIGSLTKTMLNTKQEMKPDFVDYLRKESKGNPLFLVELIRNLVAKDHIRLDENIGRWEYDAKRLRNNKVLLDSVDLTFNKLLDYESADQSVLEVASLLGNTFQFEMLMIDDSLQPIAIMRALKNAISDYLIVRSSESDEQLKHLGKTFSFSHHRIRESIKDTIPVERKTLLHKQIALTLKKLLPESDRQTLFTLAHHFNQALGVGRFEDQSGDVAVIAFKYNVLAGDEAVKIKALVSAERYFQNARGLFHLLKGNDALAMQRYVLSQLADIYGQNKRYNAAIELYASFLKKSPGLNDFARVSYKLVYFTMMNGYVVQAEETLTKVLTQLRMPIPKFRIWILVDLFVKACSLSILGEKSSLMKQLRVFGFSLSQNKGVGNHDSFHPIVLYQLGQSVSSTYSKLRFLAYHSEALKMGLSGKSTPQPLLRVLGDLAIIFANLGFRRAAYLLIDEVLKIAKKHQFLATYRYLLTMRTLVLDHFQNKTDDYDRNMNEIAMKMSDDDNDHLAVQNRLFRLFRGMLKCSAEDVEAGGRELPNYLRTRHWLSPRGVSYYLFYLLLQDSRSQVVIYSSYLQRRKKVKANQDDVFLKIIEAMVAFSSGDANRAFSHYIEGLKIYTRKDIGALFPYEEDFLLLFMMFFPTLLSHEQVRVNWQTQGFKESLNFLVKRAKRRDFRSRAIPKLLVARYEEITHGKNTRLLYDRALKASKLAGATLIEMIVQYWFGKFLLKAKQHARKEYIYRLHSTSKSLNLAMLENMAVSVLEEFRYPVPGGDKRNNEESVLPTGRLSGLSKESISILHQVLGGALPPIQALNQSLKLLRRHYKFKAVHIVFKEHLDAPSIAPFSSEKYTEEMNRSLVQYVSNYISIRSSLYIPATDAPWSDGNGTMSDLVDPMEHTMDLSGGGNMQSTAHLTVKEASDASNTMVLDGTNANVDSTIAESEGVVAQSGAFNTLVPIKLDGKSNGVILLEESELGPGGSVKDRQELDFFGAYLGLWMSFGVLVDVKSISQAMAYESAQSFMEPCDWLELWREGILRGTRESIFYLGLNLGNNEYVLVFSKMNGPQEIREDISQRLWYQILAVRSLHTAQGKRSMVWEELHEELVKVLNSTDRVKRLESISLSFSLFRKDSNEVISGHFGPSRPLTMGKENVVNPLDKGVLNLQNSRILRFWHVVSDMNESAIYVSAYETNKLLELDTEGLRNNGFFSESLENKRQMLLLYLKQGLAEGQVPRYFVAATKVPAKQSLSQLDQAE